MEKLFNWNGRTRAVLTSSQRTIPKFCMYGIIITGQINCMLKREANRRSRRIISLLIVLPIPINSAHIHKMRHIHARTQSTWNELYGPPNITIAKGSLKNSYAWLRATSYFGNNNCMAQTEDTRKDSSIKICYSIKAFNAFNNNNLIIHLICLRARKIATFATMARWNVERAFIINVAATYFYLLVAANVLDNRLALLLKKKSMWRKRIHCIMHQQQINDC